MKTKSLLMCLVGLLLFSTSVAEARIWTRNDRSQFEAELVKRKGPVITLRKPDGSETTVKMPGLSDEDRKYVKQLTKGKGKSEPNEGGEKGPAGKDKMPAGATWRMTGEYPHRDGAPRVVLFENFCKEKLSTETDHVLFTI